jgi:hypothetical protein
MAHMLDRKGRTSLDQCIRTSSYALQLDRFIPHIARNKILLLDFELLRRNPAAIVAQVCDFLDIEYVAGSSMVLAGYVSPGSAGDDGFDAACGPLRRRACWSMRASSSPIRLTSDDERSNDFKRDAPCAGLSSL